jgi:hypothetical protein
MTQGFDISVHAHRRSDYDVTNSVQVSSPTAVCKAVRELFQSAWPEESFDLVARAFADFHKLYSGQMPGYHGVDTVYHDMQHSLDMTLAMARLLAGYERQAEPASRLGAARAVMGLITSLFHDAGYIREIDDTRHQNGAEFTLYHVTRSAKYLATYLPTLGLERWLPVATRIVHFTGYEVKFDQIHVPDLRDYTVGHLLGTADLIAQMADRCYLEKCRDRLYPEFVLGGVATSTSVDGHPRVLYSSGLDLLRQTPTFVRQAREQRLDGEFHGAYRYLEVLFDGRNPYIEAINRNVAYLDQVLRVRRWPMLRRNPPLFTTRVDEMQIVRGLMLSRFKSIWG